MNYSKEKFPHEYFADIVYGVPNNGSSPFLNADHLRGNIALVDRGNVGIPIKIKYAQDAGASAVIVVDDGQCTEHLDCGLIGSKDKHGSIKSQSIIYEKGRVVVDERD